VVCGWPKVGITGAVIALVGAVGSDVDVGI
jgi:hypothetical protein